MPRGTSLHTLVVNKDSVTLAIAVFAPLDVLILPQAERHPVFEDDSLMCGSPLALNLPQGQGAPRILRAVGLDCLSGANVRLVGSLPSPFLGRACANLRK